MGLLKQLQLLIEQDIPTSSSKKWYDLVLQTEDYDDILPIIKLFGGDLHNVFKAFDKLGKGQHLLNHILTQWPQDQALPHIIEALGGIRNWDRGMVDNDLMDEYVIDVYLNDMMHIEKDKDGRIILELMRGEEAEFFDGGSYMSNGTDCKEVAKQIFTDEGLEWEPYITDMKLEELLELLTEENYIKLVRYIGTEFQNEEVNAWREEFDSWREEDQLPEGKVFLTLDRMNGFLSGDRYNLAVLIGNTPELEEVETEIQNSYGRAWNEVVQNQYYTGYYQAFEEFLGKPIGEGTTNTYRDVLNRETGKEEWTNVKVPVKYFDVTDRARAMIVRHAYEIDNPEAFIPMIQEMNLDILCPQLDDYPWEDEEVSDLFQEYLWDYL